jgi:Type II secretion system (T2SS), protein E, N-terminal domain
MNKSVEDLLARAALIDSSGIERALEIQSKSGGSLSKILADLGLPEVLPQPTGLLPMDFCRERLVVPLSLKGNSLRLAMVNPLDYPTIQDVIFRTGKEVIAVAASESAVLSLLGQSQSDAIESQNIYETLTSANPEGEIVSQEETDEDIDAAKLAKDTKLAPVIRVKRGGSHRPRQGIRGGGGVRATEEKGNAKGRQARPRDQRMFPSASAGRGSSRAAGDNPATFSNNTEACAPS